MAVVWQNPNIWHLEIADGGKAEAAAAGETTPYSQELFHMHRVTKTFLAAPLCWSRVGVELGDCSNCAFLAPQRLLWLTAMSLHGNVLPLRWDISGQHQIPFLPACSHGGDYCFWLLLALKGIQRAQLLQAESRDRKPLPASPVCGYSAPSLHALAQ